jgi:7SK snRNA methylphosphate capping enzyme
LDIGCNDGQFCIALAESFAPSFILGIDPDHVLIDSAQSRLKRLVHAAKNKTPSINEVSHTDASFPVIADAESKKPVAPKPLMRMTFLPRAIAVKAAPLKRFEAASTVAPNLPADAVSVMRNGVVLSESSGAGEVFPHNVVFKVRDIFDVSCTLNSSLEGKYDVVTCFSVTKWVHLNGGDSKLLELFCKLFCLTHQGGRVVIEYQPWKSYENNKATSEQTKNMFPTIGIKPELFEWILTSIVGFEIEHQLGTPVDEAKGFNRPILVLKRPFSVPLSSNKRMWDNVSTFDELCNIVYKQIRKRNVIKVRDVLSKRVRKDNDAEEIKKRSKPN